MPWQQPRSSCLPRRADCRGGGRLRPAWPRAENGILFLTDQRVIWEDRVGEFELKLNVPLQQVTDVQKAISEDGTQEFLDFTFGSGAPYPNARFQLGAPVADGWLKMVGRARSGGYADDRAIEIPPEELERIRNARSSVRSAARDSPILSCAGRWMLPANTAGM